MEKYIIHIKENHKIMIENKLPKEKAAKDIDFLVLQGPMSQTIPALKDALKRDYKIMDFRDLALATMKEHNQNEEDRKVFENYFFMLLGNPVIANPKLTGEHIIINDLEQELFTPLKKEMLNASFYMHSNQYDALLMPSALKTGSILTTMRHYEKFRAEGGEHITIITPNEVIRFRENSLDLMEKREKIVLGLLHNSTSLYNDYLKHCESKRSIMRLDDDGQKITSQVFSYLPDIYSGIRFLTASTVHQIRGGMIVLPFRIPENIAAVNLNSDIYEKARLYTYSKGTPFDEKSTMGK